MFEKTLILLLIVLFVGIIKMGMDNDAGLWWCEDVTTSDEEELD